MSARFVCLVAVLGLACGGGGGVGDVLPGSGTLAKTTLTITTSGDGVVRGAGSDCRGTCTVQGTAGRQLHLQATPAAGALFQGWSGACTGNGACDVTLDVDRTVTATFGRQPPPPPPPAGKQTLSVAKNGNGTVRSTPAGIDCGATCSAAFDDGTSVTLTATADPGWTFAGWGGACSGPDCTLRMSGGPREITATFHSVPPPPPPPPDECAGLVPASVPPPRVFTAPPDSYANHCEPGTTDGSGAMVLPSLGHEAPPGTFTFRFVGPDGLVKGSFTDRFDHSYTFDILEQASGYVVARSNSFVPSNKADSVFTVSPDGVKGPPQYPGSSWMIDAVNPVGGAVTALQDTPDSVYEIVSWDEALQRRWTVNSARQVVSVGVDRKGATLVVVAEKPNSGNLSAFWIDPSGGAGAGFAFGSTATRLVPRAGDGFFVYDYVPPLVTTEPPGRAMGTPLAQIDSYATEVKAPPAWLAARPHKGLHMVHGGAGYALIDSAGDVAPCGQQIEVLAPSGKSCGTLSFSIADGACRTGGLTVGYDGTVIQQLPAAMESVQGDPVWNAHTCTWRYWPSVFR